RLVSAASCSKQLRGLVAGPGGPSSARGLDDLTACSEEAPAEGSPGHRPGRGGEGAPVSPHGRPGTLLPDHQHISSVVRIAANRRAGQSETKIRLIFPRIRAAGTPRASSASYQRAMARLQSVSRPNRCRDNAVVEVFYAAVKTELVHRSSGRPDDRGTRPAGDLRLHQGLLQPPAVPLLPLSIDSVAPYRASRPSDGTRLPSESRGGIDPQTSKPGRARPGKWEWQPDKDHNEGVEGAKEQSGHHDQLTDPDLAHRVPRR